MTAPATATATAPATAGKNLAVKQNNKNKNMQKRMIHRIWFWLTVHKRCGWCHTVWHHAPLAFLVQHNHSDGVCAACAKKYLEHL
jgi:hypothetical protein